jgi:sugar porter (SP) family MFS transporter
MQGFSCAPVGEGPLDKLPDKGRRTVWRWGIVIATGGFLFGYDTGVVSGALLFFKREFALSAFQQGTVVSVLLIGAMIGALGVGKVSDHWGRRPVFGLLAVTFVVGSAIAALSPGYWILLVARLVLGLAVGGASATVPVYLSEISPTEMRGRILTLNQLMITVGILIAYFVNLAFAGSGNWRGMFAVGAVPALVMIAGALWTLPESPEWLFRHGRPQAASKVIASVSDKTTADAALERRRQREPQPVEQEHQSNGWRVLLEARVRPALIVGLVLAAAQQFGGINTIIYYAPTIIEQTGLTASNSIFYAVAIGVINFLMTIVAIRLIDRAGRRKLLLFSLAGMTVTLALLGLSFVAGWSALVALIFMVLYIASFAVGMGPVFWVLIGEIFPPDARAQGSGASTAVNWASNFVVSLVFLSVVSAIGEGETFWVFGVICALALVFCVRFVPETKDRDFADVDAALQRRFSRTPG